MPLKRGGCRRGEVGEYVKCEQEEYGFVFPGASPACSFRALRSFSARSFVAMGGPGRELQNGYEDGARVCPRRLIRSRSRPGPPSYQTCVLAGATTPSTANQVGLIPSSQRPTVGPLSEAGTRPRGSNVHEVGDEAVHCGIVGAVDERPVPALMLDEPAGGRRSWPRGAEAEYSRAGLDRHPLLSAASEVEGATGQRSGDTHGNYAQ